MPLRFHFREVLEYARLLLFVLWRHRKLVLVTVVSLLVLASIDIYHRELHAFAVLSTLGLKTFHKKTHHFFPPLSHGCEKWTESTTAEKSIACANFPSHLLSEVQVILKTGVVDRHKTETVLATYASCIENILIVSDAPDTIHGHEVIDILADLPSSYAVNNTDWEAYTSQHATLAAGKTPGRSNEGWKLDRFKFLPMINRAYATAPNAKWYVFIEADIYYFWDTLFRQLSLLNPDEYHYLGAPAPGAHGRWFAYGGAGIILSRALVYDLVKGGERNLGATHEDMARDDCCGDAVIAYMIFKELGVRMESLYPTMSGEKLEWLGVSKAKWCIPLLALHRVPPEQMTDLWRWERCRVYNQEPITFATILDFIFLPVMEGLPKPHWDNGASVLLKSGKMGNESARACEYACSVDINCLSWRFSDEDRCRLGDSINAGGEQGSIEGLVSGWHEEALGILGYHEGRDARVYCDQPTWLIPKIM